MISRSKPRRGGGETKSKMSVWTWEVILITKSGQKVDKHGGNLLGAEEYRLNILPFTLLFLII